MKKILFVLKFIFILISVPAYADDTPICQPGSSCTQIISMHGIKRSFTYYLPSSYVENQRYYNLVIALHGAGETGSFLEKNIMGGTFDTISLQGRAIIVYPDAENGGWNYGAGATSNNDDIAFIDALIQYFKAKYYINPYRIYVAGFAEGGFFAFRLACERADVITAIATVASAMPVGLAAHCKPSRHVPVLMINGTADPLLLWDSHELVSVMSKKQSSVLSVPETYQAWLTINDILSAPYQEPYKGMQFDGTWAWTMTATAANGAQVILYTIYQGGHTWPGGAQYLPVQYIGNASTLDATKVVWRFFLSNRLKPLDLPPNIHFYKNQRWGN